jgi:hypothetical protein
VRTLLAVVVFAGGAFLLIFLLDRLMRLRGSKDEGSGSQEHWAEPDIGIGDGD